MTDPNKNSTHNFFLYDTDKLTKIASEAVVKRGLTYFNEHRVTELDWNENAVWALVEGSDPDQPYSVELNRTAAGKLEAACNCGFEQEPVCKHAVAVLYGFSAEYGNGEETLGSAVDTAVKERSKKGRTEVKVDHLDGDPVFGIWNASSITSATHWKQTYRVHIRSLNERMNYCTCPDLASNQLGTCKHIEAVLHRIKKQPGHAGVKEAGTPYSFVYLHWDSATHPQIKVHRAPTRADELSAILDDYFDDAGLFKRQLPDDFFGFSDVIRGRSDIQLGDDATSHVNGLAADAAHQVKMQAITQEILNSGGILPGIRAQLYPYQVEGIAFLAARGRALLADDMGLGKTLQAIAASSWLAQNAGIERILIVCPASLKHQWAREIEKFTRHGVQMIQGGAQARHAQYSSGKTFFVINYELILRDLSVITAKLRPDLLVLDEAQRIKNWQTKIASTIKLIPSRYAFVLTGTPLENRLQDLYSLLQVVDAKVLGPLWRCMLDFHVTDERGKVIGYRNLSELRRRIATVMLRRDRRLVSEQLPERTEVQLDIPMTVEQQELHDSALSNAGRLARTAKRRPLTPSEQNRLMAALQQARMACDAAGLVDKETQGSPKLDELTRLLDDLCLEGGQKVVVFSQWELMTRMVESAAHQLGIGHVRLHGGVPTSKRGELMDRFRDDDGIQMFISTDAGGVGLNLQSASVLINLDIPWNPAVLDQRIGRIHRLGQKQKVQIFLLVAENSYEERVLQLVQGKRELFDNVVDPNASEDVVGVSKKMLQSLIEDLNEQQPAGGKREPDEADTAGAEPETVEPKRQGVDVEIEQDAVVRDLIVSIQETFGPRIERIVGSGGGLLVIMDPIDAEAEQDAEELSANIPIALIDPRAFAGLKRLGGASPIGDSKVLFKAGQQEKPPRMSPFISMAEEKLRAAEVLVEQKCTAGAAELLASAMLSAAAGRAEISQIPGLDEASVWVFSEAIPKGILLPDQASAMVRAISLARAPQVPEGLIFDVLQDARMYISKVRQSVSH